MLVLMTLITACAELLNKAKRVCVWHILQESMKQRSKTIIHRFNHSSFLAAQV